MGGGDCEGDDCVNIVRTTKQVTVPCTRNVYKTYKVKVPRQVTETKPRTVKWVDYVDQTRQVPYTDYVNEKRVKYQNQSYTVPVQKRVTKMVQYTTKEPRTVYVDVTKSVPKTEIKTDMVTRHRQVPINYTVPVPVQKFRTERFKQPVNKSKIVYDKFQRTVYDTQIKTRCEPKTTMVTKTIPVFNVVAKTPLPAPQPPMANNYNVTTGDFNNDGMQDALFMSQRGGAGPMPSPMPMPVSGGSYGLTQPMAGPGGMQAMSAGLSDPMTGPSGMAMSSGLEQPMTGPSGMSMSSGLQQPMTGPGGIMDPSMVGGHQSMMGSGSMSANNMGGASAMQSPNMGASGAPMASHR